MNEIIPIEFSGLCGNCYLIRNGDSYILVDTAWRSKRNKIERNLSQLGCTKGKLKLIVLTHGDFDHCGNAFYLRSKFDCPVGIHREDSIITERGNMFINKNKKSYVADLFTRIFLRIDTFKSDVFLEDRMDLGPYGVDAIILHLPGHSVGSIGVLTSENQLICGDLFENRKTPRLYYVDDPAHIEHSLQKLNQYSIETVFPGHGKPFEFSAFPYNPSDGLA